MFLEGVFHGNRRKNGVCTVWESARGFRPAEEGLMAAEVPQKILLVEDEALIAREEADIIKDFGYEVFVCHSGEKALEFLAANPGIQLVLLDIDLGRGIDGTETARRILETRHIPIVFLTFHTERAMVEKVRGLTRYGYVIKNSGDFVLQSSIEMAFELFNAYTQVKNREEQYRTLVENASDGIVLMDADGTVLDANVVACNISGYQRVDFLGKNVAGFFPTEDLAREPIRFPEARDGRIVNSRRRLIHKDGHLVDVQIHLKKLSNNLFLAVFHAIEERKASDEGPRRRLGPAAETASAPARLGYWELDPAAATGSWSKEMFRLFNFPPDAGAPVVSEFLACLHHDDRGPLMEAYRRVAETGEPLIMDYRSDPSRGPQKFFRTTITPIKNGEGQVLRLAGIVFDVTDSKTAEEDVVYLKEEWEAVFNALLDPGVVTDADYNVIRLNAAAREKLGRGEGEIPPMKCWEIFHGADAGGPSDDCLCERVKKSRKTESLELDVKAFGGLHRVSAFPMFDAAGGIRKIIHVAADVSETRRAETDLRRLTDDNEVLIKEIQSRVRSTLNTITGLLTMQMQIHHNPALEEALREIRQRVSVMITVYTKLRRQDYKTVSLKEYFSPLIDEMTVSATYNQEFTVEKDIADLVLDASIAFPLALVMNELITNSIKYAFPDRHAGRMTVRMFPEGASLNVEIADDGVAFEDKINALGSKGFSSAMIESLVGQLHGHLETLRENGNVHRILIPLKSKRLEPLHH
jgi:PAS domain S-box-containing protein